jgi:glutathione synthase/RimK-type ligase-like ATP-grasp enzyme
MPSVAFATYQASPLVSDDDQLVAEELRRNGVTVSPAVWDAPEVDWPGFDCVVIRSTWDYHLKLAAYAKWIRSFTPAEGRLWNPPAAVLENMNKGYLTVLGGKGIDVVPTHYIAAAASDAIRLQALLEERGWDEAVVKPAVSASALGTWRTSMAAAGADQSRFAEQARGQDTLVQPYMPEVAAKGEWSLLFFGGKYSHSVLKKPAPGDFRVQRQHGGRAVAAEPERVVIDQAEAILSVMGHGLLYARLDGIERDGRFILMEAEIIEPYLFIGLGKGAARRFAEAIMRVLPAGTRQP